MGALYKLTSPSGKSYIGVTMFTPEKRFEEHVRRATHRLARGPLYAAIRKYGADTFSIVVLGQSDSWDELCAMEIAAIASHDTQAPAGYNSTSGGDGVHGLSEEARERHQQNTAIGTKAAWADPEFRRRRHATFSTAEFKSKHARATSEATRAAYQNPEVRANLRAARADPGFRANVSEAMRRRWQDPVYRQNQVAKRLGRSTRTEESKRAQAEKMRRIIAERKANGTYWNERRSA